VQQDEGLALAVHLVVHAQAVDLRVAARAGLRARPGRLRSAHHRTAWPPARRQVRPITPELGVRTPFSKTNIDTLGLAALA
jgi:hypothetical protein